MNPAARMGDHQTCPKTFPIAHTGGPIRPFGRVRVFINRRRAARRGSNCQCVCPQQAKIQQGCNSVQIQSKPAAVVQKSTTTHQGVVQKGSPNVYFGDNKHNSQEQSSSCVLASVRNMIEHQNGNNIPENQIENTADQMLGKDHNFEWNGVNPSLATQLLNYYNVNAQEYWGLSVNDLVNLVANNPALITVFDLRHMVMLEKVFWNNGQRIFVVRDPDPRLGGNAVNMSERQFRNSYYYGRVMAVVPTGCCSH